MTPKQLREWLFQNSQVDQWWLSLESVTEESPVTVSEIEERIRGGQYKQALVLHVSQEDLAHPPWVDVGLPHPTQQSSRLASVEESEPQLPPLTARSSIANTLTAQVDETEEVDAKGEGVSAERHLMWVVGGAFMAWLNWDSTWMWGWFPEFLICASSIHLIQFIQKLNLDAK